MKASITTRDGKFDQYRVQNVVAPSTSFPYWTLRLEDTSTEERVVFVNSKEVRVLRLEDRKGGDVDGTIPQT